MSRRRTPAALARRAPLFLAVGLLLVIEIYPLVWMFLNSLKSREEYLNLPAWAPPTEPQWDNYAIAWENGNLAVTLRNSILATVPSLALILLLGVAAGFALEVMVWRGRNAVLLIILAGIMVPGQMIILPLFTIYFQLHLTGTLLPLIITYVATGLPLTVFMMAAFFRAIPREVFEAATIDGAGILRSYALVAVPMVRNAIITVAIVQFFLIWNDLLLALTFAGSKQLNTLQVGLLGFSAEYGALDYGPLFAAVTMTVAGILVLYLFLNERIMKGLTAGSVKG